MPSFKSRFFVLISILILSQLFILTASLAKDLELSVLPGGESAEIGKDLVLRLILTPAEGFNLSLEEVVVSVTSPDHENLLGSPYPLKSLSGSGLGIGLVLSAGQLAVEWAAPIPAGTIPDDYEILVSVSEKGSGNSGSIANWSGQVNIGFGKEWSADRITDFIARKGMGLFLIVVFGFGLLMSLSPCIYPMIPITLAVIGTRSQEKGAIHGLLLSVTYVLGMALVYAIMGALSATVFSGITAFMQSPVVLVPIALLLFALSFSMFGAYELEAPRFLRDRLQGSGGNKGGIIGVFAMGMVAGLVASPCVGPFLAALLVWVATTGNWILGFFSLFTFGIGMGMLLIGVGTFPAMLSSMPQSGGWMETIRRSMGLLLVAMAFFFVRPGLVLPENVFYPLVGIASIILAVFLGAFDTMGSNNSWWDRTRKGLGLVAFLTGALLLVGSIPKFGLIQTEAGKELTSRDIQHPGEMLLAGTTKNLEPGNPQDTIIPPLPEKVQWQVVHTGENAKAFLDEQRKLAREAGKPVLLDFWGSWCKLCIVLDKKVWNQPEIVFEAQRFVTIKVDASKMDDEMEAIFEEYQVAGQPTIVFIDSRGEPLLARNSNFKPADQMLELMQGIR